MSDELGDTEDERAIELSTLVAIYPELVLDPSDPYSASIEIPVEPLKPFPILFPTIGANSAPTAPLTPPSSAESHRANSKGKNNHADDDTGPENQAATAPLDTHLLSHLPYLNLRISLPDGYPAQKPPILELQESTPWLPEATLEELGEAGHSLWEDVGRDQVLYSYLDYIREAADNGFGIIKEEGEHLEIPSDMKLALLDYDLKAKRAKFEAETFECGVCMDSKKGAKCHRLSLCGHVFCVECLQDFFGSCITEGNLSSVTCMAPECDNHGAEDPTLDPSELLEIPLPQDQVQRYIKLKRKQKYESDPTTIYCPRTWCQGPSRVNDSSTEALPPSAKNRASNPPPKRKVLDLNDRSTIPTNPADRLAICLDCGFAFCIVCKASWHGEYVACIPRQCAELTAEEQATEKYMALYSTPCPTCLARCQKSMGCNHMICYKCNSHFCYLCSAWLPTDNPYKHFNTIKSPCYQRLWELEGGDEGQGAELGFGGGVNGAGGYGELEEERYVFLSFFVPARPLHHNIARQLFEAHGVELDLLVTLQNQIS